MAAAAPGVGPYSEVAMFHRASRTVLVVDAAVCVPRAPPPIVPQWALRDAGGSSFFVRLLYGDVSPAQVGGPLPSAPWTGAAAAKGVGGVCLPSGQRDCFP